MNQLYTADDFQKGLYQVDANTLSLLAFHLSSKDFRRSKNIIQMISAGTGLCSRNLCANCPLKSCWDIDGTIDWPGAAALVDMVINERAYLNFDAKDAY